MMPTAGETAGIALGVAALTAIIAIAASKRKKETEYVTYYSTFPRFGYRRHHHH